jgi:hypothetical protein
MKTLPIVVIAPLLALLDQSAAYALVEWSCEKRNLTPAIAVHAVFFVVALVLTLVAWREARHGAVAGRTDAAVESHHLVAWLGAAAGAISLLAVVMLAFAQAVLSPCID